MNINEYQTTVLKEDLLVPKEEYKDYSYFYIDRNRRKLYLFHQSYELARILDLSDFGFGDQYPRPCVAVELKKQYLCIYSEESGLFLYDFLANQLFHISQRFCYAYFDSENDLLWTIRRDDNDHVTILVYNYGGILCASLSMDDPLYHSEFGLKPLPERNHMAISFGGGQDGSQDYFLSLESDTIQVIKVLPEDVTYILSVADGQEAILVDYYEQKLFHVTYPDLKEIGQFQCPWEEWCMGSIWQVNDKTLILADDATWQTYLFDIPTMSITEEIIVRGHEAREDSDGNMVTDMEYVDYRNDDFLFLCTNTEEGDQRRILNNAKIKWYL